MTNMNTNFSKISPRVFIAAGLLAVAVFVTSTPSFASADAINRQLELGNSGSDVSTLQTFLAKDVTIYPQGLVTGYFGSLTKSAVSNFQVRNSIPSVGRVGPVTLVAINAQITGGMNSGADVSAPWISGVSVGVNTNSAIVNWNTSEGARGVVYYSNTPLTMYEHPNSVDVSGYTALTDSILRNSQSVTVSGLQPNTVYYYLVYSTDQAGNVSITLPASFRTNP